jgi:tripartite-type tricarboxylate transporter receptor subunit TctC
MIEGGLEHFTITAWDGLFAPARTPPSIIQTLNAAVRKALGEQALQDTLLQRGAEVVPGSPEEFAAFVRVEVGRWGKLVRDSGAKVE